MTVSELVDMMPIGCKLVLIDLNERPFMRFQKVTESGCICTPAKTYPASNPHESFKCRIIALLDPLPNDLQALVDFEAEYHENQEYGA